MELFVNKVTNTYHLNTTYSCTNLVLILFLMTILHNNILSVFLGASFKSNLESIRMVTFILFLTTLFVFTSYSASIAALIQSNSNSIRSIRDIVESPMTFNAQMSPYGKYYFEVCVPIQF